jgi:hypothetical protein
MDNPQDALMEDRPRRSPCDVACHCFISIFILAMLLVISIACFIRSAMRFDMDKASVVIVPTWEVPIIGFIYCVVAMTVAHTFKHLWWPLCRHVI